MYIYGMMSDIYLQKQIVGASHRELGFYLLILLFTTRSSTDAVTLTGSSGYAVPGSDFTLTCDVPEEGNAVQLYRRPDVSTLLGSIQVAGGQCYNTYITTQPIPLCSPDVCSCTTTSNNYGTVFQWVIQPQTRDHGSVWYCTRTNPSLPEADRVVNSPDYTLNVADGPGTVTLSPPDTTYTRIEGDTLPDITCTADCRPGCTFVWTKPDNTNFSASAVLSLGQLERSENGTYRCTTRNVVGELTTSVSVSVMYGPSRVALSPSTTSYTPVEGHTLPTVTCSSDCYPVCTYSWTKDGQSYTTGTDLQLTNIQRGQTGVYRCTASNGYGSQTSSDVTVNAQYGPDAITLSPPDTTYTSTEGDTLPDITCTADCRPGCSFVWTKPDNINFTASAVLSLGQLDRSEQGTYRCTAGNIYGTSTISAAVTVRYVSGTVTLSPPDTTFTMTEGDTLPDITCTADCRPGCSFVWTKPDHINFTASAVLSLGQLDRSEHGTYRCTASNVAGKTTTSVTVTVRFPPRMVSLSYTQGDADVPENGSKSLFCSVESYPPCTIRWYYKANNTLLLTTPDVLDSTYTLTTAGCLDTGLYVCSVRNIVLNTEVTRDIYINVLCKPRPYQVQEESRIFELSLSETLSIPANFMSNPEPVFTWTFQLTPQISATTLVNGADNFAMRNSFLIKNLTALSVGTRTDMRSEWFGLYTVTATNSQGRSLVSFTVLEERNPSFPMILSVECRKPRTVKVSWKDGGNTQFFRVLFSSDGFLTSKEVHHVTIPHEMDKGNAYSMTIDNLEGEQLYSFKIAAYNDHGNTTSIEAVGCTVRDELPCGADNLYIPGVALTCTGVLTLLLTVGLGLFISRYGRLPFVTGQHLKRKNVQEQIFEQVVAPSEESERLSYEQLDMHAVAKPSIYSEIGGPHQGLQNETANDREYESLGGRSKSNVYDELQGATSENKGIYINTAIAGRSAAGDRK